MPDTVPGRCRGAGVAGAGGVVRRASTTRRWAALYFGLQVVSVSWGLAVGRRTATSSGATTWDLVTRYVNDPWRVVSTTGSPGTSSASALNGAPWVVRWPAMPEFPGWPGSAVPG